MASNFQYHSRTKQYWEEKISEPKISDKIQTWGCWVRSANAASVLCRSHLISIHSYWRAIAQFLCIMGIDRALSHPSKFQIDISLFKGTAGLMALDEASQIFDRLNKTRLSNETQINFSRIKLVLLHLILVCPPKSQTWNLRFLWVTYYTLKPMVGMVVTTSPTCQ